MNVILITVDSLRADRVLSENDLTPQIDRLADDNVSFLQAITHGQGTPVAFPAILTGTYPMLYGGCSQLSPERPILARLLQDAGYETAAFTSNPHLFDRYGYSVGFDEFNQYRETGDGKNEYHSLLERVRLTVQSYLDDESRLHNIARRIYYILLSTADKRPYTPADEINTHVIEWLDNRDTDDPFFAWVHYMDTHYPFYQDGEMLKKIDADQISSAEQRNVNRLMNESPEKLDEDDINTLTTLYDAETRFTDMEIGHFLDALRERELYDNTIIIITSDHGEALGEHGGFGHYKALYEELFRVPLVIHVPTQASTTIDTQVGLVDLEPTILDYAGLEIPESTSGESLLPVIEDSQFNRTDVRHVIGHGDPLGVRTDRWKYIWWDRNDDDPLDAELFDLRADPDEMEDVSDEHPDVVTEFDAFLADHVARARETDHDPDAVAEATASNEDMEAQLEALGYK